MWHRVRARNAAAGWIRAAAITAVLALLALLLHLAADWHADKLTLLILIWVALQGGNLAYSAEPKSFALEVGRAVFISGVLSISVWVVDRLQRDFEREQTAQQQAFEERQSLQLTLGLRNEVSGVDLRGQDLSDFELAGKDLSGSNLAGATLAGANLSGADLAGAVLIAADLSRADLSAADLTGADLSRANLGGANLQTARLAGANLATANLVAADLEGADLPGACLAGADLTGAKLPGADLTSAVLTEATVDGTEFESDLRPARFGGAGFAGVSADETTWPGDRVPTARIAPEPDSFDVPDLEPPPRAHSDRVVGVEDGDTVELARAGPARLIGVDAPDVGDGGGMEARAYAAEALEGEQVEVLGGLDGADSFGRELVYLWLPDGSSFNQALLETGHATLLAADPFATPTLTAAEGRAKQLGLGYWESCPTAD